jgi:hypothetical protein
MDDARSPEAPHKHVQAGELRPWSAPQLERLDFDGTQGFTAKNPSSFEGSTSYNSGPLS